MKQRIFACILCLLICLSMPLSAGAASAGLEISASREIAKGDSFIIAVTFTSTGEAIGSLQASLSYDQTKLQYRSGGGTAVELSGGTGGIVDNGGEGIHSLTYELQFTALETGSASFSVNSSEVIGFVSGKTIGTPSAAYQLSIGSPAASQPSQQPSQQPDLKNPIEITLNGQTMYLLTDLSGIGIPDGFTPFSLTYQDQPVAGLKQEGTGLVLVCIMDATGKSSFYLYDDQGDFVPYLPLTITQHFAVLDLPADAGFAGYEKKTISLGGESVTALAPKPEDGFYLLYATDLSTGNTGYYWYDSLEQTMQSLRVSAQEEQEEAPGTPVVRPSVENAWQDSAIIILVAVLGVLCIVLLACLIRLGHWIRLHRHKPKHYE